MTAETNDRKLVVFVPPDALDAVRDAVFAAGAGRIGAYERCSWHAEGTGTFVPLAGADPAVGRVGGRSAFASYASRRCSRRRATVRSSRALRAAHPYEEPAFDVY